MLEMEKTSVTPGIRIILTENNASYSNKELRAIISALNKSLYKIAKSHGVNSPRFYYTLSGEEVAVNLRNYHQSQRHFCLCQSGEQSPPHPQLLAGNC